MKILIMLKKIYSVLIYIRNMLKKRKYNKERQVEELEGFKRANEKDLNSVWKC